MMMRITTMTMMMMMMMMWSGKDDNGGKCTGEWTTAAARVATLSLNHRWKHYFKHHCWKHHYCKHYRKHYRKPYLCKHYELPPASYLLLHPWTLDQDWSVPGCWLVQLDSYQWIGGTTRTSHCLLLLLLNSGKLVVPYTPKYWILTYGREGFSGTPITEDIIN